MGGFMEEKYANVYNNLYEIYASRATIESDEIESARDAKNMVDSVVNGLGLSDQLRSDARFFLALNISNMILVPLRRGGEAINEIIPSLQEDTKAIIQTASEISAGSERKEISSRDIIDAVSRTWEN